MARSTCIANVNADAVIAKVGITDIGQANHLVQLTVVRSRSSAEICVPITTASGIANNESSQLSVLLAESKLRYPERGTSTALISVGWILSTLQKLE